MLLLIILVLLIFGTWLWWLSRRARVGATTAEADEPHSDHCPDSAFASRVLSASTQSRIAPGKR